MNQDPLEKRLREKLPTPIPRPGFETRIQALAREPYQPAKHHWFARIALPTLAVIILLIVLAPRETPSTNSIIVETQPEAAPVPKIEEPVSREYQGLKNDAQWTLSLFRSSLPSIPASKKENKK